MPNVMVTRRRSRRQRRRRQSELSDDVALVRVCNEMNGYLRDMAETDNVQTEAIAKMHTTLQAVVERQEAIQNEIKDMGARIAELVASKSRNLSQITSQM